ncbi:MAG TPA: twin-arginine translocase TatA/TatE family subunit [Candidatus Aveggerthella stercoripullorum]|uniref:Twin-arginine translocase TatA/TatE family subunit n=1 Tax=Candidatus Aveggerthella stercoripullorum TaxID=2840688 RepID=A0A9D1A176_9ACTN|nr:twin-arginine translocase TatA/TatE family subunit [Candidatus Aveggerthella stercoripullorum]
MFGIGGTELFLILLFGFLLFGPDKLPSIAKTAGKAIAKFRNAQEEVTKVVQNEIYDPKSDEPFKNPLEAVEKLGKKSENKTVAKQESFSERKARYDRERAARRAAEQEKAAEGTSSDTAARTAKTAPKPAPKAASAAKPASSAAAQPATAPSSSAKPAAEAKPASSAASSTTTNAPSATSEEKGE